MNMEPIDRRRVLGWLTAATLSVALLVGAAPATALAEDGFPAVGVWSAQVVRDDGVVENGIQLKFFPDGRAVIQTPESSGGGRWQPTGRSTFRFRVVHPLVDEAGHVFAYVHIEQNVTLTSRDSFSGRGFATAYDLNGNVIGSGGSSITAVRVR